MKCSKRTGAIAHIRGDAGNPRLRGSVRFLPHRDGCLVVARISGLPETETGFFAFHIHEGRNCGGVGFAETMGHLNPANRVHPLHAGDLPPLMYARGNAFLSVVTDRFCAADVIGKTVVIHNGPDDFTSQPAGNAGMKIACGVISKIR